MVRGPEGLGSHVREAGPGIGRDEREESRGELEQQELGIGARLPKNAAPVFTGFR